MQCQDTYKEVREFKYPNAIVRVYIPDLAEEERNRRIEQVKRAVINMFKNEEVKPCTDMYAADAAHI